MGYGRSEDRIKPVEPSAEEALGASGGWNANDELIRFLSQELDVPLSTVRLVSGTRSRSKTIMIRGPPWPLAGFPISLKTL